MAKESVIILCSGGLDSVATSYLVRKRHPYYSLLMLFFNYGQSSLKEERKYAKICARDLSAKFKEIKIPEIKILSAPLKKYFIKKEDLYARNLRNTMKESLNWYVPCRNLIFISYALAYAESVYIRKKIISSIYLGFKSEGKEPFPDATAEFIREMNRLNRLICKRHFPIFAPLIKKDKEEVVFLGKKIGVDFKKTFSCYSSKNGRHCGVCLACRLRKAGFYWAGIEDPTRYYSDGN